MATFAYSMDEARIDAGEEMLDDMLAIASKPANERMDAFREFETKKEERAKALYTERKEAAEAREQALDKAAGAFRDEVSASFKQSWGRHPEWSDKLAELAQEDTRINQLTITVPVRREKDEEGNVTDVKVDTPFVTCYTYVRSRGSGSSGGGGVKVTVSKDGVTEESPSWRAAYTKHIGAPTTQMSGDAVRRALEQAGFTVTTK